MCLIVDVNFVLGLVHCVGVGDVANVLELFSASFFMVNAREGVAVSVYMWDTVSKNEGMEGGNETWGLVPHLQQGQ